LKASNSYELGAFFLELYLLLINKKICKAYTQMDLNTYMI
jgi:hypothetical protein